ncbi:MAG: glutathione synthase [Gammaproteobacteria bacterium]
MRLLFVIDDAAGLNAKTDSSITIMRAAAERGDEVHLAGIQSFVADGEGCSVLAQKAHIKTQTPDDIAAWCETDNAVLRGGDFFDAVMMRKEPPVDGAFLEATLLLDRMAAPVFNAPRALREQNEKLAILDFPALIPPTIVAADINIIADFHNKHKGAVLKPLDGMGGRGVLALAAGDLNLRAAAAMIGDNGKRLIMAQKYVPEAKDGDKRIFVIDGKAASVMLARKPQQGDHRSNMAAGGQAKAVPLGAAEKHIADIIAPTLKQKGVLFAGLDIIGECLTEINITCPTGLQVVKTQTGEDLAADILAAAMAHIGH